MGYPYNLQFEAAALAPFLAFSINNLGDPFNESNYGVHSRQFELEVLDFFANLWDIEQGQYWYAHLSNPPSLQCNWLMCSLKCHGLWRA